MLDKGKKVFVYESNDYDGSNSSIDIDVKILEENFGQTNVSPKLQRIFKTKPVNLTKNWYNKPTPPDLQFEERVFQNQFFATADKLY
jgi:hypothetical protein